MSRVFWDTDLFIYLFEDYGMLSKAVGQLRSKMLDRGDQLLTSTLTLGEMGVRRNQRGDSDLCRKYEHAICAASALISFDVKASTTSGRPAFESIITTFGAVQLACAASANVD